MKLYIADAFADSPFCGNPAGVVILPQRESFPHDQIMIKTAAELRYSETAFVQRISENDFVIRYFTPKAEVDLCGHATVAAFSALRNGGYISENCICTARTRSGDLHIRVDGRFVMMDMASPQLISQLDDEQALAELYGVMGLDLSVQREKGLALPVQIISTGLPDIMLPVADKDSLYAIDPDHKALSALSERYGAVGVHAFCVELSGEDTCLARNFAPLYGINEEAATGTASGALTYYGYLNGFIRPDCVNRFMQGVAMGRPSPIITRIGIETETDKCRICVGGTAAILVEGEIYL